MAKRSHISLRVKLAAALLQTMQDDGTGKLVRVISHEDAKRMTADEIIARFHLDHHPIPHAAGGPDEPWNLTPLPVDIHREKTARVDVPAIAKAKRLTRKQEEFRARLTAKASGDDAPEPAKNKRPWPKRKMRSHQ